MPATEYPFELAGGVPVLTAPAEIDVTTCGRLRAALSRWHARGHATVVVDLAGTVFCDLAGLRELALAHKRARAAGGGLRLVVPVGGELPRILALTGLDRAMPRFATVDQALAWVPAPMPLTSPGPFPATTSPLPPSPTAGASPAQAGSPPSSGRPTASAPAASSTTDAVHRLPGPMTWCCWTARDRSGAAAAKIHG
ncbi:MAG TPA: STAS domain-containing protein [Trebonia sp.]|nr:STAS domain-containing protein [Trebonia sp.]